MTIDVNEIYYFILFYLYYLCIETLYYTEIDLRQVFMDRSHNAAIQMFLNNFSSGKFSSNLSSEILWFLANGPALRILRAIA